MSEDRIFIRREKEGPLVALSATRYEAESVLQHLLEEFSELLAGSEMRPGSPRRFVLVRREAPVPDHQDGGGRWSIDHVFIDQEAVPTLVEVKRSTDTRIRREVVGQMLDYAANGTRYWGDGQLRTLFEQTCKDRVTESTREDGPDVTDPAGVIASLLDSETNMSSVDDFWQQAELNLRAGRIRLVFVADVIPEELRAIIEFLNEKLMDVEIFGVEVRRYTGPGSGECYVPRLIGATAAAIQTKRNGPTLEEKFDAASPVVRALRKNLESLASDLSLKLVFGPGSLQVHDHLGAIVRLYPGYETIEFPLDRLRNSNRGAAIEDLLTRLQRIHPGKTLTDKSPNIGCAEAEDHWDEIAAIIGELTRMHAEPTNAAEVGAS